MSKQICGTRQLLIIFASIFCCVIAPNISAQTEKLEEDVYERAERLLGPNLGKTVRNGFTTPHWIGPNDRFWYRKERKDDHEFVLVDAATGKSQPAFDHDALAKALGQNTNETHSDRTLPFNEFSFNDDLTAISFFHGDSEFECRIAPAECTSQKVELNIDAVLHESMSFRSGPEKSPPGVKLSPDGDKGVFVRDGNLWLVDMASGKERALTDDGKTDFGWGIYPDNRADFIPRLRRGKWQQPVDTTWSPDGRLILVPLINQRHVKPYPFIESVPEDGSFRPKVHNIRLPLVGEKPATLEWYLIDIETDQKRWIDLPYEDLLVIQQDILAVREISWSDDYDHLYLTAHGSNMEAAYLFEIDTQTGASRTVIKETMSPRMDMNISTYSPVNVCILKGGTQAIWWSQRSGWGHLYRYDIKTGKLMNTVTQGDWLVRDIIEIDEQNELIYFTGSSRQEGNPYYRYLYRVDFEGQHLTLLSPENADHLLLPNRKWVISGDGVVPHQVISPSGQYAVYNYSRVDQPTKFVIRRTDNQKLIAEVEEADATNLYAAGWRPPEEFSVLAQDGQTELWGVIYKPSNFDPTISYPVIDAQYASPLIAITPRHFYQAWRGRQPLAPSSYAELGFIVVSLDARGTTNRSREFLHHGYGQLNKIGLGDHVHAIREIAKTRPYMDLNRVGITGHSYGGYAAIRAMLEYPDFFKVGISSAGMGETHAMYHDYHWTAFHGRPTYSNGTPWRNGLVEIPEKWKDIAASTQANKLKGDLLIQFGELDENVPPAQLLQFIDALMAENKDFDMLYLPNRDHQFIGEGYILRRNWDYMVEHLANKTPPENYKISINGR